MDVFTHVYLDVRHPHRYIIYPVRVYARVFPISLPHKTDFSPTDFQFLNQWSVLTNVFAFELVWLRLLHGGQAGPRLHTLMPRIKARGLHENK